MLLCVTVFNIFKMIPKLVLALSQTHIRFSDFDDIGYSVCWLLFLYGSSTIYYDIRILSLDK